MIELNDHGTFARFEQDCRKAAARLQPEINDSFAESLTRVRGDVQRSAASILPRRGGLGRLVAGMTFVITKKSNGAVLTGRSKYNIASIDSGLVNHLVYGRGPLVRQNVHAGFWSTVVGDSKHLIEDDANKAIDRVIKDFR